MKKFRLYIFTLSQCLLAFGLLTLVLIALFSANVAVQHANKNIRTNVLPTIILDPGHGGEDGGAQSKTGVLEKDLNLKISQKVESLLLMLGVQTVMTRTEDRLNYDGSALTMREKKVSDIHARFQMMEETPNAVFLSIHQNHFSDPRYDGTQVFYSANRGESEAIARAIQRNVSASLQPDNTRAVKPSGDEIYLLYHARIPAVMVECGFLSNPKEAELLNEEAYQIKIAICIVQGLLNYFNDRT